MYLVRINPKTLGPLDFSHTIPFKARLRVSIKQYDIIEAEINEFGNISKFILFNNSNYTHTIVSSTGLAPINYKQFDNLYDVMSYLLSLL